MFSHVMIGSNDIPRSKKFYDAVFGAIGGKPGTEDAKGRLIYSHNGGVFLVSKPIDGKSATHANGGTIADAEVQIINSATNLLVRKVNTGPDGTFVATLLPPGSYIVAVNKPGFSEARTTLEVRVTETTTLSISLKPGVVTERIEISAQVATVDTTNATTGQSIGEQTVRDLKFEPLRRREFETSRDQMSARDVFKEMPARENVFDARRKDRIDEPIILHLAQAL